MTVAFLAWLLLCLSAGPALAQTNPPATCTRSFINDVPNQPLVTVSVAGAAGVSCLTIEEILPASGTPVSISADGVYLPALNAIRWGPYFKTVATNVSYRLTGLPASYPVNGGAWMDGAWYFSPGVTMVTVLPATGTNVTPSVPPQVATPTFSPAGGTSVPTTVTISCATPGAGIYYTLDGTPPTQSSTPYSNPVALATAGVLRAAAFTNGWSPSVAAVAYYGPPAAPANAQVTRTVSNNSSAAPMVTFNVTPGAGANCVALTETLAPDLGATAITGGGNYVASNNVVLWGPFFGTNAFSVGYQATGLPGTYPAKVSWSVDGVSGSETVGTNLSLTSAGGANVVLPTPSSQVPTPILIPLSGSAVPVDVLMGLPGTYPAKVSWSVDGVSGSETAGTNLIITAGGGNGVVPVVPPQVATPVLLPPLSAGLPVSVTITDATPGAVIYYTLDGTAPTAGSTPYTGAVPLATASVLRAAAFTNGWTPSIAVLGDYVPVLTTNTVAVTNGIAGNDTIQPVVSLTATPQGAVSCYAVVETIPFGLTPSALSGDGIWDRVADAIRWGPYLDNQPRVFSFNLSGPSGTYPLSGQVSVNGYGAATGPTNVQINTSIIGAPPQIGTQPSNQVALAGSAVQFTVGASGSTPLIYQWFFNTNTPLFTPSTTAALNLPVVTTQSVGRYSVVITNLYGGITSSPASLAVVIPLVSNIVDNANGSVTLNFIGLPNVTTRIWATTNLTLPADWLPIFTNTTTTIYGTWQYIDSHATGYPARFYRFSTP